MKRNYVASVLVLIAMVVQVFGNTIESDKVLIAARRVMASNESVGGGVKFNRDCSGTVNAIFAEAGYPLSTRLNKAYTAGMNGTAILHAIAEPISNSAVEAGDLVFFDDTYDRNNNGLSDDVLTHVGIVTRVDKNSGVVTFIHYNTWMDEIVEQNLSLQEPSNRELNITLRWPSKTDTQTKRYAGELVHSFGRITTW